MSDLMHVYQWILQFTSYSYGITVKFRRVAFPCVSQFSLQCKLYILAQSVLYLPCKFAAITCILSTKQDKTAVD